MNAAGSVIPASRASVLSLGIKCQSYLGFVFLDNAIMKRFVFLNAVVCQWFLALGYFSFDLCIKAML